jgi:hypothetical protein
MAERCPHCGTSLSGAGDAFCPECRQALDAPPPSGNSGPERGDNEIAGLEGLSNEQILWELQHGARFVVYQYCVSLCVVTIYRASRVHFIRSHESAVARGMTYTLLSLLAGWWGFPFGPIFTIAAVYTNLCGGRDVTPMVGGMMDALG